MAFVALSGVYWPSPPFGASGIPDLNATLIDAAGEKAASIFTVPKTGTVSKVLWRTGGVTTGADCDVRLETVASGLPSGTLIDAGANGTQAVLATDDNTMFATPLTTPTAVTRGNVLAVVIAPATGFVGNVSRFNDNTNHFPYTLSFTTSWTKHATSPVMSLEYSDGSYAQTNSCWPMSNTGEVRYNANTAGADELGLKFTLPVPVRCGGAWVWCDLDGDGTIKLYDASDTLIASRAIAADEDASINADLMFYPFSSSVDLDAGVVYRLTLLPTTATSVGLEEFDVLTAAQMDCFGGGQALHHTKRVDAGAWTDTTTKRPFMGLIIEGLHDGVGGGAAGGFIIGG